MKPGVETAGLRAVGGSLGHGHAPVGESKLEHEGAEVQEDWYSFAADAGDHSFLEWQLVVGESRKEETRSTYRPISFLSQTITLSVVFSVQRPNQCLPLLHTVWVRSVVTEVTIISVLRRIVFLYYLTDTLCRASIMIAKNLCWVFNENIGFEVQEFPTCLCVISMVCLNLLEKPKERIPALRNLRLKWNIMASLADVTPQKFSGMDFFVVKPWNMCWIIVEDM